MCPSLQQHFPAKIQCGARKEVGTTARYIGHVPAASAGTAWRHRWEMVKALIVAHGFVVFNFLPHKKKPQNKQSAKNSREGGEQGWQQPVSWGSGLPAPGRLHFYRPKPTTKLRS